jgi:hypothetical protein
MKGESTEPYKDSFKNSVIPVEDKKGTAAIESAREMKGKFTMCLTWRRMGQCRVLRPPTINIQRTQESRCPPNSLNGGRANMRDPGQ